MASETYRSIVLSLAVAAVAAPAWPHTAAAGAPRAAPREKVVAPAAQVIVLQAPVFFYAYGAYKQAFSPPAGDRPLSESPSAASLATAARSPRATEGAAAVLLTHCAACHTGQAARAGLAIFDAQNAIVERLPRQAILEAVSPSTTSEEPAMPPGQRPKLSADELRLIAEWARPPRDLRY